MCGRVGAFGSCIRLVLAIFNIILFLLGALVFSSAAIIRWKPDIIINDITNDQAFRSIMNISALDNVSIALLSIGGAMIVLGLIGLIGSMCTSRFFLIVYEVLIILIFFCHGVLLLLVSFKSNDIELQFRKELNKTIDTINNQNSTDIDFKGQCDIMKALSAVFKCCGANGSNDFQNQTLVNQCCDTSKEFFNVGCADKTVDTVTSNAIDIVLIPNSVLLGFELLLILSIPFLIGKIKRKGKYYEDRQVNYLRPTSEFRKSYGTPDYHY